MADGGWRSRVFSHLPFAIGYLPSAIMRTILFLCTGNYYRSRYAEIAFNHAAAVRGLAWRAASTGLRVDFEQKWNKGPLSPDTRRTLAERGIACETATRMPMDTTEQHLAGAALIVALKEAEHRPLMAERFPAYAERVRYWDVTDVPPGEAYHPLREIDALLARLLDELSHAAG